MILFFDTSENMKKLLIKYQLLMRHKYVDIYSGLSWLIMIDTNGTI